MKYYLFIVILVIFAIWILYDAYKKFNKYKVSSNKLLLINIVVNIVLAVLAIPCISFIIKGIQLNFTFKLSDIKKIMILNVVFFALGVCTSYLNSKNN